MKVVTLVALHKVRRVEPRGQSSYMIHDKKMARRENYALLLVNNGKSVMPFTCLDMTLPASFC